MDFPVGTDSHYTGTDEDPTPFLFISLDKMELNKDLNRNLIRTLESHCDVAKAETEDEALKLLNTLSLEKVLIADGDVADFKNKLLRDCLVEFVKEGGTVVHACAFSSFVTGPCFTRYFKYGWGLPWDRGDYNRDDYFLTKNGGQGIKRKGLPASYSQKALSITNVAAKDALYLRERLLPGPSGGELCQAPIAFRKIGAGYMGYVGDVNHEEGSNRVILAMFGLN